MNMIESFNFYKYSFFHSFIQERMKGERNSPSHSLLLTVIPVKVFLDNSDN